MSRFHETTHGVYFDDLDPYGILHNARYLLLFERTLGSFWTAMGFGDFQKKEELVHLVKANTVEYLRPVIGQCTVRVRVSVARLGRTSLTYGFRMMPMDEDTDFALGTRTVVRVDATSYRPLPWTDAFRDQISPWLPREDT